jgi:hypothetical protein
MFFETSHNAARRIPVITIVDDEKKESVERICGVIRVKSLSYPAAEWTHGKFAMVLGLRLVGSDSDGRL